MPVLPRAARHGQLPVLFRADVRRGGILPEVRRAPRESGTKAPFAACPACRSAMARVIIGELALLECVTCDGVWVDAARSSASAPTAKRRQRAASLEDPCARVPRHACALPGLHDVRQDDEPRELRPDVRNGRRCVPRARDFSRRGRTARDRHFIRDGGLERARQREIDDLEEERHRLRGSRTQIDVTRVSVRLGTPVGHACSTIRRLLKDE